MRIEFQAKIG
jgi:hypothetical protein